MLFRVDVCNRRSSTALTVESLVISGSTPKHNIATKGRSSNCSNRDCVAGSNATQPVRCQLSMRRKERHGQLS